MDLKPNQCDQTDLPAELTAGAPRRVHLTGTGWVNLLAGVFFFALGVAGAIYMIHMGTKNARFPEWGLFILPTGLLVFGVLFVRKFPLQHQLATEGFASRGCIREREWKGPSRGPIIVDYTFTNASGEVEIGSYHSENPHKAGSMVCVLYMPSDPGRSAIYPLQFFQIER